MKDIVTFETAKRLKEAGFPQPEPEARQWWYSEDADQVMYLGEVYDSWIVFSMQYGDSVNHIHDGMIYAPSAADILYRLGYGWAICIEENNLFYTVKTSANGSDMKRGFLNQNPAEAAAEAYLHYIK